MGQARCEPVISAITPMRDLLRTDFKDDATPVFKAYDRIEAAFEKWETGLTAAEKEYKSVELLRQARGNNGRARRMLALSIEQTKMYEKNRDNTQLALVYSQSAYDAIKDSSESAKSADKDFAEARRLIRTREGSVPLVDPRKPQ